MERYSKPALCIGQRDEDVLLRARAFLDLAFRLRQLILGERNA